MITEDYVSLETSKLLKEKGFNEQTDYIFCYYEEDNAWCFEKLLTEDVFREEKMLHCPSLAMTMKWLREVHKLFIEIEVHSFSTKPVFKWFVSNGDWRTTNMNALYNTPNCVIIDDSAYHINYEEAVENAIKYCLTII